MSDIEQILEQGIEAGADAFRQSYEETGYINTGGSYRTIQPRPAAQSIVANPAVHSLVFGRGPSEKYPPWGYEKGTEQPTSLMEWCMAIFGQTTKEAKSTSFLVARKIREEGNQVHRGLKPPIPVQPTIDKVNEVVFDGVSDSIKQIFRAKQ